MKRIVLLGCALAVAGCATRPSPHPLVPKRALHSGTATLAATGGVAAAAVGAHLNDARRSPEKRKAGAALVAAGAALMGAAILDAARVQAEREILFEFDAAWRRDMKGSPAVDLVLPPPLPPPPVIPWEFKVDSPLAGEEPEP